MSLHALQQTSSWQKVTEPAGCIILADFLCCWGPSDKGMGLGGLLGRTLGSSSAQSKQTQLSAGDSKQ